MGFSRCQQSIMGGPDNRLPIKKKVGEGVIVILQSLRFSFFFHRNVFLPQLPSLADIRH